MLLGWEGREIGADFREHDLRRRGTDAIDEREVDASESPQLGAKLLRAASVEGKMLAVVRVLGNVTITPFGWLQCDEHLLQTVLIGRDLFPDSVVERKSRR